MNASAAPVFDMAEVSRALALLHPAGHTFELRVPNARMVRYNGRPDPRTGTAFGFFDSADAAIAALPAFEGAEWPGLYVTLNPVVPALLSRAANRVKAADRKSSSTSDRDVAKRTEILIDVDAMRPADVSATDEEHEGALERIAEIRWLLSELGLPAPIMADSGNGAHLMYRVDLPAEDGGLVKEFLNALADAFDDERVHVDRTVFNAARIVKLYGTAARKGDSTPDRPHRMSRMLDVPAERGLVTEEMLREATAALRAGREEKPAKAASSTEKGPDAFNVRDFMSRHFPDAEAEDWHGGTRWILDPCPFNSDHKDTSAAVLQTSSGVLAFKCWHNGCAGVCTWRDLREKYEPKATRPAQARQRSAPASESKGTGETAPKEGPAANPWTGTYDVATILERSGASGPRFSVGIETIDERLTLSSQPAKIGLPLGRILGIEGPPHAGKSLMLCQMALSLVQQGLRVLCLVADEPREDAAERIGQGLGFRHAELNGEYPKTIQAVRAKQTGLDLQLLPDDENDEHPPTIEEAAALLLSVENESGYILTVDSINKARSGTERDVDSSRERIEKRMSVFRRLRRENGKRLSIIFTAEANRASYASPDEKQHSAPMASGAESRDLEFVSDVLLVLKAKLKSKKNDLVRVQIPKNRVGRKYELLSLRRHDGSASFRPVSEEAVEAEAEGRQAEADSADRNALVDKIVSFVASKTEPLSKAAIERSFNKGLLKKFGGRQAIREAIDYATEDLDPPRLQKVKATGREGGGGFVYRTPRPESQDELPYVAEEEDVEPGGVFGPDDFVPASRREKKP